MTIERRHKFHVDWSLNITSIIGILVFLFTIVKYGNATVSYLRSIDAKTNIMWVHFDKTQMSKDELIQLGLK